MASSYLLKKFQAGNFPDINADFNEDLLRKKSKKIEVEIDTGISYEEKKKQDEKKYEEKKKNSIPNILRAINKIELTPEDQIRFNQLKDKQNYLNTYDKPK